MDEIPEVPPVSTFVVRFWREWSAAGARWRGRIEHVQSGKSASCHDLAAILRFIQDLGVMADSLGHHGRIQGHHPEQSIQEAAP